MLNRRHFLAASGLSALPLLAAEKDRFKPSLAEWSIHRAIEQKKLTNLDFPSVAQKNNCLGVEFVNTLWAGTSVDYVSKVMDAMSAANVAPVLIMIDDEGMLGSIDQNTRETAVQKHIKWADIAGAIGAKSIRVNIHTETQPQSPADVDNFLGRCTDALTELCAYSSNLKTNVLVENHGGISSDPDVLVRLVKKVNMPNFGLLPDFGNFPDGVDKVAAVRKMMPYAKAVSFKCYFEGSNGTETKYDIAAMFKVVEESKYKGFVGIEYEGDKLSEMDGIKAGRAAMTKYGLVG
jgi:sugar phosphate isomerase/epimerase